MGRPKTYFDEFVAEQKELAKLGSTTVRFAGPRRPGQLREHMLLWLGERLHHLEELHVERRAEGRSALLQEEIERLERITSDESAAAMLRLVDLVVLALLSGDQTIDDVIWLAEQIDRRWRCRWVLFVAEAIGNRSSFGSEHDAEMLKLALTRADPKAEGLDVAHVARLLDGYGKKKTGRTPIDSVAGLAARLAVDCGAFGYKSVGTAKAAFKKALQEKKSTQN